MSEKMRSYRNLEEEAFKKETAEISEPKDFLETILEVRKQIQEAGLWKERPKDDKAGFLFEGKSTEDAKDKLREIDEIKIEEVLSKLVEKRFTYKNLEALGENALLLNFEQLSQMFDLFSSLIMELDPASGLKRKLLILLENIKSAMRLKAPKQ